MSIEAQWHADVRGALRSQDPVDELVKIVRAWKVAGCTQDEARQRLTEVLREVASSGPEGHEDAVRDVLDFVVGFCSPHSRLFP